MMYTAAPTGDWRDERRFRRIQEAALPWRLRQIVRGVHRDDLAAHLMRALDDRVLTIARQRGLVHVERRVGDPERTFVRRCDEHAIFSELAARPDIVGWFRREARQLLRGEHCIRLNPSQAPVRAQRNARHWRLDGDVLTVESDVALGSSRYLEGEPDGWALWVADQISVTLPVRRGNHSATAVIGAGVGGIARALAARGATRLVLDECDWIHNEPTDLRGFRGRRRIRRGEAALEPGHHAVALVFPSPGTPAASQHRRIYSRDDVAAYVEDPSRLGPRRWLRSLSGHLELAVQALRPGHRGYLLLPTSVRDARAYLVDEQLARGVHDLVAAFPGLHVLESNVVQEVAPVAWPFVGTARPSRLSFVVEREPI